jgi:GTP cyclohydrolase I
MSNTRGSEAVVKLFPGDRAVAFADSDESFAAAARDPAALARYEALVRTQLELLGEDPTRDGLLKTPGRVAKAMAWLTRGYEMTARDVIGDALFEVDSDGMVMVRDIELYSMCEHHMLPSSARRTSPTSRTAAWWGSPSSPASSRCTRAGCRCRSGLTEEVRQALEDVLPAQGRGRRSWRRRTCA